MSGDATAWGSTERSKRPGVDGTQPERAGTFTLDLIAESDRVVNIRIL
jgi:hypothetical protein